MRAVIFDFDGTIADSFSMVMTIAYDLTKHEQLKDINQINEMRRNNVSLTQAINSLGVPRWKWAWLLRQGRRMMSRNIHKIPLFDGMGEALFKLYSENYELYIITSNSKNNVERFLSEKGILTYFRGVYGGAGLFNKQRLIKKVLKTSRLDAKSTIYVGDEVRDVMAAKTLNMPVIAVTWGYNSEQLLLTCQPTIIVRSPEQLSRVIVGWGKA